MSRGSGFKRKVYEAPPPAPVARATRASTYAGTTTSAAPKTEQKRHAHLLTLARDQLCLLQVPGVCCGDPATTVACHSNYAEHGKSGARKADDCWSVWGCVACHTWLDQGKEPFHVKHDRFLEAMARQVDAWLAIAADETKPQRDRAAAGWALRELQV